MHGLIFILFIPILLISIIINIIYIHFRREALGVKIVVMSLDLDL